MLAIAVLSVVLLCVESTTVKNDCIYPAKVYIQADYYWRDYFGAIPKDAIPGGYQVDGNVTYIGQTSHITRVGIFPGTIYPGQKEGVSCPGQRFVDAIYVKILCSNAQNNLEWIKTTIDESPLLTDYHWVIGGTDAARIFYIGRVNFEGEVQIGRVYNSKSQFKGLWICNKAGNNINFESFELLVLTR